MTRAFHDACADLREHLLALDDGEPLDIVRAEHVASCDACAELYASLMEVDTALADLPPVVAPPELVMRTLARLDSMTAESAEVERDAVDAVDEEAAKSEQPGILRGIFDLVFGGFAPLLRSLFWPLRQWRVHPKLGSALVAASAICGLLVFGSLFAMRDPVMQVSVASPELDRDQDSVMDSNDFTDEESVMPSPEAAAAAGFAGRGEGSRAAGLVADDSWEDDDRFAYHANVDSTTVATGEEGEGTGYFATAREHTAPAVREPIDIAAAQDAPARDRSALLAPPDDGEQFARDEQNAPRPQLMEQGVRVPTTSAGQPTSGLELNGLSDTRRALNMSAAQIFLRDRERTTGLHFQPARGHWSNTYIPGDPELRSLRQRLVDAGAMTLGSTGATGLELAEASQMFSQPFDAPRRSALALYVHADQRAAEGERRLLLQVGLRGAARRGGARPPMNVAVVLDLTHPLAAGDQARVRALLEAIGAARDVGDRISLSVAGPRGGVLVASGSFRHGQVQVALEQLFHDAERSTPAVATSLDAALRSSLTSLAAHRAPSSSIGSSFALVITPQLASSSSLERAAHVGAVAGIPTSVVGLGHASLPSLDRLALAGQGRRRLLADADSAPDLVRAEFDAISQVVARAIRLRIRLAPGTRLVAVLGSHRLGVAATARVREAERSIDQRLAHSLGIQADREEDADGITLFIPAFYANDSHVILLDVVASGPGPIADVTARYKDLLRLGNGEAHASLRLARGTRGRGPLERAVFKNLLAHELSVALSRAANSLSSGDTAGARARLTTFSALSRGVRELMPALATDHELAADFELAQRYDLALQTMMSPQRVALADSLRLASRRKTYLPMFSR